MHETKWNSIIVPEILAKQSYPRYNFATIYYHIKNHREIYHKKILMILILISFCICKLLN